MRPCPSCGAPLDSDGICTSCGALARGFFRGLDLGAPQVADAVARGLDFYRLLEVASAADTRAIARRYRQLRALFPDNPASLEPAPARRLALLEVAGRTLTDPRLRQIYDQLRSGRGGHLTTEVVRCSACSAPLAPGAAKCTYCSTPRPAEPVAPTAPPADAGPPPTEPIDYYGMFGLTPEHLIPSASRPISPMTPSAGSVFGMMFGGQSMSRGEIGLQSAEPPSPADVDMAARAREREVLLSAGYSQQEREARLSEIEIGRRILRDHQWRGQYDALLMRFSRGQFDIRQLDALHQLQMIVRAEIAEERGEQIPEAESAPLLRQGLGYLEAGLPREAVEVLRRVVKVLPRSVEAHAAYAHAILASDDPLALGGHVLRQALASLEALEALGPANTQTSALATLCRGLLARDLGDAAAAEAHLQQAVQLDGQLAAAWRAGAALALARGEIEEALSACRRALAADPRDERALLMIVGACLRARRRSEARDTAAQIAALRGEGWTADSVLQDLEG